MSDLSAPRHWPRGMIIFARIICPFVLAATFAFMELALAYRKGISDFTEGMRWFIHATYFTPFFLGVLLGHWFHPVPGWYRIMNDRLYKNKQMIPPIILLTIGGLLMGIGWGIHSEEAAPTHINFIMVLVGIVLGGLLWPVRVLPPAGR